MYAKDRDISNNDALKEVSGGKYSRNDDNHRKKQDKSGKDKITKRQIDINESKKNMNLAYDSE